MQELPDVDWKGLQTGLTVEQVALAAITHGVAGRMASCIGCGCTDDHRCRMLTHSRHCIWLRVDREVDVGLCSRCAK